MATHPRALSVDDVLELPLPDGVSGYEFVDGRPVPVMPASLLHGELIVEVARVVANFVIEHGLPGKVYSDSGFVLGLRRDRERMRGPDVAYVELSKLANADPERLFRGVPDFVVEIDLTSAKKPGGQQRILDYLEAGVRLIWAIDPHSRSSTVYRPDGSGRLVRGDESLDGEDVLPGLRVRLADLFR